MMKTSWWRAVGIHPMKRRLLPRQLEPTPIIDVWVTSGDPEHNDILRLDEMMSRKSISINAY